MDNHELAIQASLFMRKVLDLQETTQTLNISLVFNISLGKANWVLSVGKGTAFVPVYEEVSADFSDEKIGSTVNTIKRLIERYRGGYEIIIPRKGKMLLEVK